MYKNKSSLKTDAREILFSNRESVFREDLFLYTYLQATCDLSELAELEDERWDEYNVLGQVINVLREAHGGKNSQNSNRWRATL